MKWMFNVIVILTAILAVSSYMLIEPLCILIQKIVFAFSKIALLLKFALIGLLIKVVLNFSLILHFELTLEKIDVDVFILFHVVLTKTHVLLSFLKIFDIFNVHLMVLILLITSANLMVGLFEVI